jgi:hypothetical protein
VCAIDDGRQEVFAVVRLDLFLQEDAPVSELVTVKEILPTNDEAADEASRLNSEVDSQRVIYVVQPTRYYSEGRRVTQGSSN